MLRTPVFLTCHIGQMTAIGAEGDVLKVPLVRFVFSLFSSIDNHNPALVSYHCPVSEVFAVGTKSDCADHAIWLTRYSIEDDGLSATALFDNINQMLAVGAEERTAPGCTLWAFHLYSVQEYKTISIVGYVFAVQAESDGSSAAICVAFLSINNDKPLLVCPSIFTISYSYISQAFAVWAERARDDLPPRVIPLLKSLPSSI